MESRQRVQHLLETALNMETRGQAFYAKAAEACQNPFGRAMFDKLHQDEVEHVGRIDRLFKAAKAGADWAAEDRDAEQEPEDLVAFFRELAKNAQAGITAETSDLEALDVGLEFERNAVQFYQAELAKADGPVERRFLERLVAEERGHVAALTELKAYLVDPQAWFKTNEALVADG